MSVCEISFPFGKIAAGTITKLEEAFKDEAMGKKSTSGLIV